MSRPTLRRFFWYLFAVPRCAACHHLLGPTDALRGTAGSDVLCLRCRGGWEQEKLTPCPICGEAQIDCRCMPDALAESGAAVLVHLGEYRAEAVVGQVILRLKDTALRRAADFAAAQLVPALRREIAARLWTAEETLVTYLPRSRRARREHGHDQAELIARALGVRLGACCLPLLVRAADGAAQKTLTAEERAENVRGLFATAKKSDCNGRCVILVDDVVTTGASMAEGVRVLRAAGAACVICAAVGMTQAKEGVVPEGETPAFEMVPPPARAGARNAQINR